MRECLNMHLLWCGTTRVRHVYAVEGNYAFCVTTRKTPQCEWDKRWELRKPSELRCCWLYLLGFRVNRVLSLLRQWFWWKTLVDLGVYCVSFWCCLWIGCVVEVSVLFGRRWCPWRWLKFLFRRNNRLYVGRVQRVVARWGRLLWLRFRFGWSQ